MEAASEADRFEHERAWEQMNTLARAIAQQVLRGEPVSDALREEYSLARQWWESCMSGAR